MATGRARLDLASGTEARERARQPGHLLRLAGRINSEVVDPGEGQLDLLEQQRIPTGPA